jgi:hypothetical protein
LGEYKLDHLYREKKNKSKVGEASTSKTIGKKQGTSQAKGKKKGKGNAKSKPKNKPRVV